MHNFVCVYTAICMISILDGRFHEERSESIFLFTLLYVWFHLLMEISPLNGRFHQERSEPVLAWYILIIFVFYLFNFRANYCECPSIVFKLSGIWFCVFGAGGQCHQQSPDHQFALNEPTNLISCIIFIIQSTVSKRIIQATKDVPVALEFLF